MRLSQNASAQQQVESFLEPSWSPEPPQGNTSNVAAAAASSVHGQILLAWWTVLQAMGGAKGPGTAFRTRRLFTFFPFARVTKKITCMLTMLTNVQRKSVQFYRFFLIGCSPFNTVMHLLLKLKRTTDL